MHLEIDPRRAAALLLAITASCAWPWAAAQPPKAEASVQALIDALDAPPAFRSIQGAKLPDVGTNLCASRVPASVDSRTLGVVAYAGDTSTGIDLDVQFVSGSDSLSARDRQLLDNLAAALNHERLRDASFALAGHTDSTGSDVINLKLSCARSLKVREYLLGKGVAPERLTAYGFGSNRPMPGSSAAMPQNRRVEVRMAP